MFFVIFFLFGLIIGSFLNVVIARLRTLESILGRSFCRHCRKKICWYDNIPLLSFVVLAGKCRHCRERISWQYPLVEFLTAILFGVAGMVFFSPFEPASWIETAFVMGVIAFAVVISAYDAKYKEIPMTVLWMGILWAGVFLLWLDAVSVSVQMRDVFDLGLHSGVSAALAGSFFFFLLSAVSRERWMGLGDAYVVFWIGLVLGWPDILVSLLSAFTVGAAWGVGMIVFGKSSLKSQVPFAPFLLGAMVLVLFLREWIPFSVYLW
jgi:prepilin signal peptidase PulO-like enzyme (type II secretory pathway)